MKDFLKGLLFIFMPHYWIMNERYGKVWDKELNELMSKYKFEIESEGHIAKLGNRRIWIANHPYSSFMLIKDGYHCSSFDIRPSRLTIWRAERKLKEDTIGRKSKFQREKEALIIQLRIHD